MDRFFALGTILSWLLSTLFRSPPSSSLCRSFFASLRHLCHEPVSTFFRIHISGRIASRKNYNCIKDVPRPAHCSPHSRGVESRRGISIDFFIDFFMEFVQPRQWLVFKDLLTEIRRGNCARTYLSAKLIFAKLKYN